jgi:lipoate-protein ligase A
MPTLRLYAWEPGCLSLGYAQPYADIDLIRLRKRGWDAVRRPTGGRAILHTDELTYSIVAPIGEPLVAGTLLESYSRIGRALLLAVQSLGLAAEMKAQAGERHDSTNPVCFEVPSAHEITINGKKLIGSAQARRKDGVLQHGSLPLTGDLSRITQTLRFSNEDERRAAASRLLARATTVESALGRSVGWDEAAEALPRGFEQAFGLAFERRPLSSFEQRRADALAAQKYGHPSWSERA